MKKRVITITTSVVLAIALCSLGVENVRLTSTSDRSIIEDDTTDNIEIQEASEVTPEIHTRSEKKSVENVEIIETVTNIAEEESTKTDSVELTESTETIDTTVITNNKDSLTQMQNDSLIVTTEALAPEPTDSLINQITE